MTRRAIGAVVALAIASSQAAAQPTPAASPAAPAAMEQASALVERGTTHFNVAEYDEAIAAFKEAYKLVPTPVLLYNVAQAYRHQGRCDEALRFYRTYLREEPTAPNRAKVELRISEMEACIAGRAPSPSEPIAPSARTASPAAPAPTPAVPSIDPAPSRTGARDRGRGLRLGGLALVGGGALALAAGGAFAVQGHQLEAELEDDCADGCTAAVVIDHDQRGAAADRRAAIAVAGGAVLMAAGVGVYLWGRSRREQPSLAVTTARGGGTVLATWAY